MENYKVKVNNESESKEVQELFFELGYGYYFKGKTICNTDFGLVTANEDGLMAAIEVDGFDYKEITVQYLRDLVVLKRNDVNDATHICGLSKVLKLETKDYKIWDAAYNVWVDYIGSQTDFRRGLKPIGKEAKMKEYIAKVSGYWVSIDSDELVSGRIEVPEGAEIFLLDKSCGEDTLCFVKHDGEVFHEYYISGTDIQNNTWIKGTIKELHKGMGEVLWKRNHISKVSGEWAKAYLRGCETSWQTNKFTPNTIIQEKLKFIEKWLNGEKIQYILGDVSDKSQWHNFTEGAMRYIKRSDIKFREAPKYVTINGIEFKSVESLLKHVKNNFDLEDGE